MFTKNFDKESAIYNIIINFRSRRNSSTRDFITFASMIFNSVVDDIKYDNVYGNINTMIMDLYGQIDRVKFLRYKMCL